MSLPSGYKRLEYIQSTGTQYVNSNFKANQDTRVVIDFEYISGDVVFGAYDAAGANGFGLQAASNKWYTYYGTSSAYSSTAVVANIRLVADVNKNVSTLNGAALRTATANTFSGANPLIISGLYNANAPAFLTALKIYSCQIYDNGRLVRDFTPCQTTDGTIGLWDNVNSVFYGNAGTGTFTAGPIVVSQSEIIELEYIQSTKTQYINSLFTASGGKLRVLIDFSYTSVTSGQSIFGAQETSGIPYGLIPYTSEAGKAYFYAGSSSKIANVSVSANERNIWDLELYNGTLTYIVSGVSKTASYSGTPNKNYPYFIFANNHGGTAKQFCSAKLYSFKIYDNGTLIRDYIPAKLDDGTVGLYDKLNGLLYINAGTGTFEAGPSSLNLPVNIGGTWKDANEAFVNIGGTWKTVKAAFVNIDGTWEELS